LDICIRRVRRGGGDAVLALLNISVSLLREKAVAIYIPAGMLKVHLWDNFTVFYI